MCRTEPPLLEQPDLTFQADQSWLPVSHVADQGCQAINHSECSRGAEQPSVEHSLGLSCHSLTQRCHSSHLCNASGSLGGANNPNPLKNVIMSGCPSLEVFKAWLDAALSSLGVEGVPFNPNQSIILLCLKDFITI